MSDIVDDVVETGALPGEVILYKAARALASGDVANAKELLLLRSRVEVAMRVHGFSPEDAVDFVFSRIFRRGEETSAEDEASFSA